MVMNLSDQPRSNYRFQSQEPFNYTLLLSSWQAAPKTLTYAPAACGWQTMFDLPALSCAAFERTPQDTAS